MEQSSTQSEVTAPLRPPIGSSICAPNKSKVKYEEFPFFSCSCLGVPVVTKGEANLMTPKHRRKQSSINMFGSSLLTPDTDILTPGSSIRKADHIRGDSYVS